ncbi:MAG: hypothetical protein EA350_14325 [Gemmatimonadales bacterium]|nr:MAG: hypothetical protein EA350_14325 [Gemmatimonadales bacterium]
MQYQSVLASISPNSTTSSRSFFTVRTLTSAIPLTASACVLAAGILCFHAAPAHALQIQDAAAIPTETAGIVQPGDKFRIQVWRQEEFSGEFFVNEQGVIAHPLYRQIRVADEPVESVERRLRDFLQQFEEEPNFVIEAFFQVAVGGEVRVPDIHFLRPGTTIAQAVALAGGPSERGLLERVILRREGVDYLIDLTDPAVPYRNTTIRSRDEILVDRDRRIMRDYVVPIISVAGSLATILRFAQGR